MIKMGVAGRYKIVVKDSEGSVKSTHEFDNLITDSGLDILMGQEIYATYVRFGTGNTEPTYEDTTLEDIVIGAQTWTDPQPVFSCWVHDRPTEPIRYNSVIFAFTVNDMVPLIGYNVSEIGVFCDTDAGSNQLMSRSLIRGDDGFPDSILIADTDLVLVYWEFRLYIPTSGGALPNVEINGIDTAVEWSAYGTDWVPEEQYSDSIFNPHYWFDDGGLHEIWDNASCVLVPSSIRQDLLPTTGEVPRVFDEYLSDSNYYDTYIPGTFYLDVSCELYFYSNGPYSIHSSLFLMTMTRNSAEMYPFFGGFQLKFDPPFTFEEPQSVLTIGLRFSIGRY